MSPKVQKLEGRPHIVVPVVMGVAGVWDGSNGPLLYAADDLKASVPLWNGKPVVVYHPDMRTNCTAGHPDVFNRQRVGTIFNARFDGSRLKAEAWLDPERLTVIAPKVLASVKNGLMMEVSTGLFTENQPMPAPEDCFTPSRTWPLSRNTQSSPLPAGALSVALRGNAHSQR